MLYVDIYQHTTIYPLLLADYFNCLFIIFNLTNFNHLIISLLLASKLFQVSEIIAVNV